MLCLTYSTFFISDFPLTCLHLEAQARVYRWVQPSTHLAYTAGQVALMSFCAIYLLLPMSALEQLMLRDLCGTQCTITYNQYEPYILVLDKLMII